MLINNSGHWNKYNISLNRISKPVPPLSGLTGLIIGCTIDAVTKTLLLVPISTNTKLEGLYLKLGKDVR